MKKIILINLISLFFLSFANANDPKSIGKFKNWETFTYNDGKGKICFAQTIPLERSPNNFVRKTFKIVCNF